MITKLEETLEKFMQASMANQKNTEASIINLETQVGQLAKQLADQQGSQFSANTQTSPKEHCNSITIRSGKVVGEGIGDNLVGREMRVEEEKIKSEGEKEKNREKSESSDGKREKNKKSENQVRSSPLKNVAPLKDVPNPRVLSRRSKERLWLDSLTF